MKTIGILHTFLPLEGNWRTNKNWILAIFSVQKVYMFQSVICVNCWSFWHSMKSTLKTMDSFLIVEHVVAKNATPKTSNKLHNRCDMKSCQIMNWCNFPLATHNEFKIHNGWKILKKSLIWRVFENLKLAVLPDSSIFYRTKLVENEKYKWDIFGDFQTICIKIIADLGAYCIIEQVSSVM